MNLSLTSFSYPTHLLSTISYPTHLLSTISNHLELIIIVLICIPFIIIVLALFQDDRMKMDYVLDSEADWVTRQSTGRSPIILDVVFKEVPHEKSLVIYDKNDPAGTNLLALFAGKTYRCLTYQGRWSICVNRAANKMRDPVTGENIGAKLIASTPRLLELESRGLIINSNGQAIGRTVLNTKYNTTLYINKDS